jgi:hypothetical protein
MAALNLGPLHHDKANYIFNNNRLLVGCLERDKQKTEAWFGKTLPSVVTGAGFGWRLYTTANGSEPLMATMSQLHPALQAHCVGGNSKAYFSMSTVEQLEFLKGRYNDVVDGRCKYSEREGGELKTMANVGVISGPNASDALQVQRPKGIRNLAVPDLQQPRPTPNQPHDQISASLAKLGIASGITPTNQNAAIAFKKALLGHIDKWALHARDFKETLTGPAGKLYLAFEIGEILSASRIILQHMYNYCVHFVNMKAAEQHNLRNARTMGLPVDILKAHESLVKTYLEKEKKLRVIFEEMKKRFEALQAASSLS